MSNMSWERRREASTTRPCQPATSPHAEPESRFRRLLGDEDWQRLPPAVQRRFARRLEPGDTAAFLGEVATTRLTVFGRLTAQLARLVGAPLPLRPLQRTPAAVLVTENDPATGSQLWTRIYHEPGRLPQVICSIKQFAGPTGLEECVGHGIGMALTLHVEARAIVIRSAGYFWRVGGMRLRIPDWMTPGSMTVIHREERAGQFSFTLTVTHALFGVTIQQIAFFRDVR